MSLTLILFNSAAAALSWSGSAGLTMAGVVSLSWTGSLFFSTLENYVPNNMTRTKSIVIGLKYLTGIPIRCVEYTSNQIFGFAETAIIGHKLPTNVTKVYKLSSGPKLQELNKVHKSALTYLLNRMTELRDRLPK